MRDHGTRGDGPEPWLTFWRLRVAHDAPDVPVSFSCEVASMPAARQNLKTIKINQKLDMARGRQSDGRTTDPICGAE